MRLRMRHRGRLYDLPFDHVVMVQEEQTGVLTLGVPGSGIRVRFGANLTQDELDLIRRTIVRSADEGLPSLDLDEIAKEARMGRKDEPRRFRYTGVFVTLGTLAVLFVVTSFRSPFEPARQFVAGLLGGSPAGVWGAGALFALFCAAALAWHAFAYFMLSAVCAFTVDELRGRVARSSVCAGVAAAALCAFLLEWRFASGPLRVGFVRDLGADGVGIAVLVVWLSVSRGYIRLPKRARPTEANPQP